MKVHAVFLFGLVLGAGSILPVAGQPDEARSAEDPPEIPRRHCVAARVDGAPPVIDGRLDDAVWNTVEWSGDFVQRNPSDGDPPSQQTRFKIVYDDDALYFAFRMFDDPDRVSDILARRDWFPGDWIEVNIDSYADRRTAFSFTLSLSETRGDELISNDGSDWDSNWDPVWSGATRADARGWTAETRIPLSQLRFQNAADQTWGLQVQRRIFRLEERSTWQRIPKDSSGWVSQFGEIRGLRDLKPKRRIELLPYAVATSRRAEAAAGDPFFDGSSSDFEGGLDGKIGLTSNLTLDFTVNPDFGQVEADPSQVNLSAFETFFAEKRPFFIEGRNILDLRLAPAITGGSFTRDRLFYSRRIGRRPHYSPSADYVDIPQATTILGAFKLSGRTANGLSIGVLESATARERARIETDGVTERMTVEPLTNYFVGRLQQDYHDGDTQLGGMLTAVNRSIDDPQLEFLPEQAYAGGIDFSTYFRDRDYRLEANLLGSTLRGSEEAILEAQTSSARYFQRPDNDSASLDPTRTELSGHSGSVRFTRTSNHDLMFQTGVAWRSPGFEINDLGFMRRADEINQFTWVGYNKRNPFSIFDRWSLNGNQWLNWDLAGNFLGWTVNTNSHATFRNKYNAGLNLTRDGERVSNTALRGGPSSRWPGNWSFSFYVNSDHRKDLTFGTGGYRNEGDENSSEFQEVWANVSFRPTNAMRLSLNPSYSHNEPEMQYVGTESFGDESRYLFARLDQKTFAVTLRLDYSITPNLTVQLYGAPFVSTGRYSEFKRITNPRASRYRDRFAVFDDSRVFLDPDDGYEFDETGDGIADYGLGFDPDFDFRDFNSNLVVRWEYSPGSTVYFVWSQMRRDTGILGGGLDVRDDLDRLFSAEADNVVLVKFSKWFAP